MSDDLISRNELKESIRKRLCISSLEYLTEQEKIIVEEINNASTVEPVKQCKFCKHCGDEDYCSDCHSDYSLFEYYKSYQNE